MDEHKAILGSLQKKKEDIKQIVISTILIGVGVNTLTSGIIGALGVSNYNVALVISGAILCAGAVAYYFVSSIKKLNRGVKYKGFIIYNPEDKSLVPVSRYSIMEDMIRYLSAAFAENKAIKLQWESSMISDFKLVGGKTGERAIGIASESGALFID